MNSESSFLLDIWSAVEEHIVKSQRQEVAGAILRAFRDYEIEPKLLAEAVEEDNYLEAAYKATVEDDEELDGDLSDWGRED